jgi:peptidoglycan LD-endopeptidase CwlK
MLDQKSIQRMAGVDQRLQAVIGAAAAICPLTFIVTEGLRSNERQKMLFAAGKTQTMHSEHLKGRAVDVCVLIDGKADWTWANYVTVSKAVKAAAQQLLIPVEWGGDWVTFKDGPHFQLMKGS